MYDGGGGESLMVTTIKSFLFDVTDALLDDACPLGFNNSAPTS